MNLLGGGRWRLGWSSRSGGERVELNKRLINEEDEGIHFYLANLFPIPRELLQTKKTVD